MAIKLGTRVSPETVGILGQILKNCRNLREVAFQMTRFQRLNHAISHFQVREEKDSGTMIHTTRYPLPDDEKQLLTELNLSANLTNARKILDFDLIPKEMRFSHRKPDYI